MIDIELPLYSIQAIEDYLNSELKHLNIHCVRKTTKIYLHEIEFIAAGFYLSIVFEPEFVRVTRADSVYKYFTITYCDPLFLDKILNLVKEIDSDGDFGLPHV